MPHDPEDTPVAGLRAIPLEALPIPDEVPTAPDLPFVTCPRCHGALEVLAGRDGAASYRRTLIPCETCKGDDGRPTGFVTRAAHSQFHADHGDEVDTIPPPSS